MRIIRMAVAIVLVGCSGGAGGDGTGRRPMEPAPGEKGTDAPQTKSVGQPVCATSPVQVRTVTAPGTMSVRGNLDSASCDEIVGWAQDPNAPSTAIPVAIYADGVGPLQASAFVAAPSAHEKRPDLCSAIMSCDHEFTTATPKWLHDGLPHEITAYGISVTPGVGNAPLGAAVSITCPATKPVSPPPATLSCSAACEKTNPQEFELFHGYQLLECGCTGGGACYAACEKATTLGSDSPCARCLAGESEEGLSSTCTLAAAADCADDGACQNYQACAGACP
jgi:hypothetical protein